MSWEKVALGDLYDVHNGLSKPAAFFGHGEPFLTFRDVFNNFFLPSTLGGLVDSTDKERASYSIRRGDIFVTRTSETYDELGMSSVALVDYRHATYNGFTKRLRPKDDSLLPEFIGYYLRGREFRSLFQQFAQMTTRASLKNDELLSLRVPVPPLPIQRRIAGMLSAYDKLIENDRRQIELLEEAAQRLYKEWFIDLRFPGYETTPIVDGLPEGWRKAAAEECCGISIGKTPPRKEASWYESGTTKWASVADLGACSTFIGETKELINSDAVDQLHIKVVPTGTILLSFKMTIGRVAIASGPMATNEAIAHFQYTAPAFREYLYEYLRNFEYSKLGSTSSISTAINSKIVKKMPLVVPDLDVVNAFHSVVGPIFDVIEIAQQQIAAAREARDRLLSKLMSEEIEV